MTAFDLISAQSRQQDGPDVQRERGAMPRLLRRLPVNAWLAALILIVYVVVAIFAPAISPFSPTEIFVGSPFQSPDNVYWLGTDNLGRDVLSRVLYGSRTILLMAGSAAAISAILGGLIGMFLGYLGGVVDEICMRALEIIMSIPSIIFALLIVGIVGASGPLVSVTVGLLAVPNVSRVMRAAAQQVAAEDFIAAARARGETRLSIVLREILPNVAGTLIVEFSIRTGYAILFIGGLGFLGFGATPPTPDWGLMVNEGRGTIDASIWPVAAPAVCMAVLVTTVNIFTDGITRILGPADTGRTA
ncbi:MAG TPA: ABC transporter permease [Dongiaceae bacterium]|nr:ABC transporter permease [Dongiaceae bacterium]